MVQPLIDLIGIAMPEPTPEVPTPTDLPQPEPAEPAQLPDDHPLVTALAAQKAKNKELAALNEQLAPKAQQLDEIEEANKSEMQKIQDQLAAAQTERDLLAKEKERNALVAAVAKEKELDPALVAQLQGDTEDALRAAADLIKSAIPTEPTPAPPAYGGKQGEPIGSINQILTTDVLDQMTPQQIEDARKEGRLNTLLGITS